MPTKNIILTQEMVDEIEKVATEDNLTFTTAIRHVLRVGLLVLQDPKLTGKKAKAMARGRMDVVERRTTKYTAQDFFK